MQKVVKNMVGILATVLVMGIAVSVSVVAQAKTVTRQVTMDLNGNRVQYRRPSILDKAKKVKVKSSKRSVVSVKYRKNQKDRRIAFTLKKKGNATVTVRCVLKNGQKKIIRYKIKVTKKHIMTALEKGQKAFAIQNEYRKEKGTHTTNIYLYLILKSRNGQKRLPNWNRRFPAVKRNYLLFFISRQRQNGKRSRYAKRAKQSGRKCQNFP